MNKNKIKRFLSFLGSPIKCVVCKSNKIATDYYLMDLKSGRQICLQCKQELKKHFKIDRIRRNIIKSIIQDKKQNPCTDCGECFPSICMDFDHTRGKKSFEISKAYRLANTPNRLLEEIQKCDLVCANCHRDRTQSRLSKLGVSTRKPNKAKQRRESLMEFIRESKINQKCVDCKQLHAYWKLDYDHIEVKAINVSLIASTKHWGLERTRQEISRCELVCANCHRIRTSNQETYPAYADTDNPIIRSKDPELICMKCGKNRQKTSFDKGRTICRVCRSNIDKQYKQSRKEHYSDIKRVNRTEMSKFINSLRSGNCIDCGVNSTIKKLQFTPKPGVLFIEVFKMNTWSKIRVLGKLNEYDLICLSCSGIRRFKNSLKIRFTLQQNSM